MEIKNEPSRRVVAELTREELSDAIAGYVASHNPLHEKDYFKHIKLDVYMDEGNKPDGCQIEIYY